MEDRAEASAPTEEPAVVSGVELLSLKDGKAFMVSDHTRILSHLVLLLGDRHPIRLSATLSKDNAVFTFHGANRAIPPVNGKGTPRGAIHIERRRCLSGKRLYERVRC